MSANAYPLTLIGHTPTTAQHAVRDQFVALWQWRQLVAELYSKVRAHSDPYQGWTFWCQQRAQLFQSHPQSPLGDGAILPDYFAYDPSLRFEVDLSPVSSDTPPHHLPAGRDGSVRLVPFAMTSGLEQRLGRELILYWIDGYGGGVFLPFLDQTSGDATYDGGRYLLDTIKGADLGTNAHGHAIVDFNFSYNPSCAYSDVWVCPLAPLANRLPKSVQAGETTPRFHSRS